jgi:hypothetical protein
VLLAAMLLGKGFNYKHKQVETISINGAADTNFVSDLAVWSGSFSRTSMSTQEAFEQLKKDEILVKEYIQTKGLKENEIRISSVSTEKLFNTRYDADGKEIAKDFTGNKLEESITIESKDLAKVDKISREITQLIQQGVELDSHSPDYYYTKLGDLKIDLLAKASADGRKRAETICKNAKSSLGNLQKASMGVFQITGQNENDAYESGGAFNTSSINKTAKVTVKMEFESN